MAKKLRFTKMQGIGNDYVYVNGFEEEVQDPAALAVKISDRHFGVGSDGLVLILPSAASDLRMRMFNADGTEAEMCGNAARCVGKYAYDHNLVKKDIISLETAAGVKIIQLLFDDLGQVGGATVDMGEPALEPAAVPVLAPENCDMFVGREIEAAGRVWRLTAVGMGNPHAIVFLDGIDDLDLPAIGPQFEKHGLFPRRTNTEFVEVAASDRIRMRVWERGAGETLACGTGACAALAACVLNGLTGREIDIELKGGVLHVRWDQASNHVYMSGPAVAVFDGEYFMQ